MKVNEDFIKKKALTETGFDDWKENIIEYSTNVFYSHTRDHKITYISPQVEQVLGYTQEEAKIKWTEFTTDNPINEAGYNATIKAIETGRAQAPYELELKRKDGNFIFVEVREAPVLKNGKVIAITGSLTDITQRKKAQILLKDSLETFRIAMEVTKDGLFDWNLVDNSIYYSPGWKSILGYSYEELPNEFSAWEKLTAPKDVERSWKMHEELIQKKRDRFEMELRMKHKDGHWVTILSRAKAIYNEEGKAVRVIGTHVDISERKKAEAYLAASEAKFRSVLEDIELIGIMLDTNGNITFANDYLLNLTGWKRAEIINKNWFDIFIPQKISGEIKKIFIDATKNGKITKSYTNEIVKKDGSLRTIFWNNTWHTYKHKNIISITSIGIDITERLETEKALIQSKEKAEESDRLKSAFLANMSHEIRTPMNGILGFSTLLKNPELSGEKQTKYINIIHSSGERMLRTLNNIIEISRIETGLIIPEFTTIDLNNLFSDLITFFQPEAEKKNIKLIRTCKSPCCESSFVTDEHMFESIMTNLIKNAIKFTENGRIEFGCKSNLSKNNNEIEFFVKDTGVGIPKEKLEVIFERFMQADIEDKKIHEGAGLGLSISKAYVDLLHGKIWVDSLVDSGSTFHIILPYTSLIADK